MVATQEQAVMPQKKEKKSFMSRLRRSKKETKKDDDRSPSKEPTADAVTREGVPVISSTPEGAHIFKPSDVRQNKQSSVKNGKKMFKKTLILEKAPNARDSAFSGPPRYDWIDIETAAAVKVQSVFRRNKVMNEMEAEGMETAAMRNRKRRRGARKQRNTAASEDAPGLFQCCGMGLMFGDTTEEDEEARREYEKAQYEEKKRQKAEREAGLRAYKPRAKDSTQLCEAIELVE